MPDIDKRLIAGVRTVVAVFREFEQAARGSSMSVAQYRILLFLRKGPKRAGQLAWEASVRKPSITPVIATLERNGWVRREADPDDRRSSRLTISAEGLEQMRLFEGRLAQVIDQALGGPERERILDDLDMLHHLLAATKEDRFRRLEQEILDGNATGSKSQGA